MDLESTYKAVSKGSLWEILQSTQVIPYLFTQTDSYVCFLSMKSNTSKIGRGVLTRRLYCHLEISDFTVASLLFVGDLFGFYRAAFTVISSMLGGCLHLNVMLSGWEMTPPSLRWWSFRARTATSHIQQLLWEETSRYLRSSYMGEEKEQCLPWLAWSCELRLSGSPSVRWLTPVLADL